MLKSKETVMSTISWAEWNGHLDRESFKAGFYETETILTLQQMYASISGWEGVIGFVVTGRAPKPEDIFFMPAGGYDKEAFLKKARLAKRGLFSGDAYAVHIAEIA